MIEIQSRGIGRRSNFVDESRPAILRLPPELRLLIYEFIFAITPDDLVPDGNAVLSQSTKYISTGSYYRAPMTDTSARLLPLLTCRVIYGEARIIALRYTPAIFQSFHPYADPGLWWGIVHLRLARASALTAFSVRRLVLVGSAYARFFHSPSAESALQRQRIADCGLVNVTHVTIEREDQKKMEYCEAIALLALLLPALRCIVAVWRKDTVLAGKLGFGLEKSRALLDRCIANTVKGTNNHHAMSRRQGWVDIGREGKVLPGIDTTFHHLKFHDSDTAHATCIGVHREFKREPSHVDQRCEEVSHVEIFLGGIADSRKYLERQNLNGFKSCDGEPPVYVLPTYWLSHFG